MTGLLVAGVIGFMVGSGVTLGVWLAALRAGTVYLDRQRRNRA